MARVMQRVVAGKSQVMRTGNILLADAREWTNCWAAERVGRNEIYISLEKNSKKKSDSAYVIKRRRRRGCRRVYS